MGPRARRKAGQATATPGAPLPLAPAGQRKADQSSTTRRARSTSTSSVWTCAASRGTAPRARRRSEEEGASRLAPAGPWPRRSAEPAAASVAARAAHTTCVFSQPQIRGPPRPPRGLGLPRRLSARARWRRGISTLRPPACHLPAVPPARGRTGERRRRAATDGSGGLGRRRHGRPSLPAGSPARAVTLRCSRRMLR